LAESRKQGGMASFSGVTRPKAAWERGIEPSQTPKFLPPFPWEGRRLFLVTVALSPRLLGWRHLGSLGRMKKGGLCLLWVYQRLFSFRMPNTRRKRGASRAGVRRTTIFMRVPSFLSTCASRARSLSVYALFKKSEPNFGGFIDFPSILCYSIINLSRKEPAYANHQKRRGHFVESDRRL